MSRSKIEDLGFLELVPSIDPVVDIVAIHGLGGHREETWTTDGGILWLRDLLPSALPNARVLTYGYDADTRSRECVSTQTIRQHADGFAKALARKRTADPRRPVIFIAHNLGGIIVKWALVICHNQNLASKGDLRDILVSTHGVLFFGTPHSGMDNTLLETINRLASMYMKTTDGILKDLREHSSELATVQSLYVEASEKIASVFFCEEYKTPVDRKRQRLNVPHHSAIIPGDRNAPAVTLHSDHGNLVRFPTVDNDNYQTVLHYLSEYFVSARQAVHEKWLTEDGLRLVAKGNSIFPNTVDPPVDMSVLFQLPMVAFAPSSVHNPCLKGTRAAVLDTISKWANDDSTEKPIFWLCDIAGSGKSTVAMSAVEAWRKQGILGGAFFFSMASNEGSNTDKFCSTVARELVQHIHELGPPIAEVVKRNPALLRSSFDEQFRILITGPLQQRKRHTIIVIDAIDECKSGRQRKELVETLSAAAQESNNLRIFITSRPDPVIEKVLQPLSIKAKLTDRLHDTSHRDNVEDIGIYVHQSLGGILSSDKRQRLANKASGLFIWASTACRMLNDESLAIDPGIIYDRLISIDQPGAIDDVYDLVLERIEQVSKPAIIEMLGMLLAAFEPLTIGDLEDLIKHAKGQGSAKALVQILGTVIKEDPITHSIQFRHPTFVEYLRRCCIIPATYMSSSRIHINISHAHSQAASWCLHRLKSSKEGLKFNICQIESSFYLNRQIPDLEARVKKYISRRLRYASLHWPFHVSAMDDGSGHELQSELAHIVKSPFALYWMEILSVTGGVMRAVSGLRAAAQRQSIEKETRHRMNDIRRFLMAFSVPIQDSAPHIYISSLPFSPRGSKLHIEGLEEHIHALKVTRGLDETYPGLPRILQGHQKEINAVAFLPDGSRIVSGSHDQTLRLWDAETGQPLGEPLRGHQDWVTAVAFSPDGSRIVSGSYDWTIRLWDAETGQPLGEPLRGHEHWVWAVAFSPDGSRIVSVSADSTIRLWDAETGQPLGKPLRDYPPQISTARFSPDRTRVVSGSNDNTIQIRRVHNSNLDATNAHSASLGHGNSTVFKSTILVPRVGECSLLPDGWVQSSGRFIFWVPPPNRHGIQNPNLLLTMPTWSHLRATHLDFTNFQCGTSWTKVRTNL